MQNLTRITAYATRAVFIVALQAVCLMAGGYRSAFADEVLVITVRACAEMSDDAERLACYDGALALDVAAAKPSADMQSKPPAAEAFGMEARLRRSQSAASSEVDSITARIVGLTPMVPGERLIELDNGQTWHQTERADALPLKEGDTVTISRAAFGSFRMTTSTGRAARVTRIS